MAFTGIAALAAASAETVTVAMVLSAVTEVGVAMTVVGAVTGNKDLMKVGGVMSMVGGIGGMMAGASGAAAAGADAAASAEGASVGAANAVSDASYAGADWAGAGLDTATAAPVAQTAAVGGQTLAPVADQSGIVGQAAATQPVAATAPVSATPTVTQPAVTDVSGVQGPTGVTAPVGAQAPGDLTTPYTNPTDMRLADGSQVSPGGAPITSNSLFAQFSDWANQNKTLMNTGSQLIGGALHGASEQSMWDQQMGLKTAQFNRANSIGSFAPQTIPRTGIIGRAAS